MVERGTVCLGPGVVEGPFPAGRVSYNILRQCVSPVPIAITREYAPLAEGEPTSVM
jgi:hypothetical protein